MKKISYIFVILSYFVILSSGKIYKTKITIYYETLCSDCIEWIVNQLHPNYNIFAKYIQLDFVPFGKAEYYLGANGQWQFECQHGKEECYGNAVQACVLHQYLGDYANLEFITCYLQTHNITMCGKYAGISIGKLSKCMRHSNESSAYLASYGTRTTIEVKNLFYVPWVLFNGYYYQAAEYNLYGILCWLHRNPPECSGNALL